MCPELFHPWNACQLVEEAGFLCKDLPADVLHGRDTPADVQTELFEFACRSKALESLPAHASQSHLSSDATLVIAVHPLADFCCLAMTDSRGWPLPFPYDLNLGRSPAGRHRPQLSGLTQSFACPQHTQSSARLPEATPCSRWNACTLSDCWLRACRKSLLLYAGMH